MKISKIIIITLIALCIVIDHVKPVMRVSDQVAFKDDITGQDLAIAYIYHKKNKFRKLFRSLNVQFGDAMNFVKLDLHDDKSGKVKRDFKIDKVPVFILFKYGRERARLVPSGQVTSDDIKDFILVNFGKQLARKKSAPATRGFFFNWLYGPRYYREYRSSWLPQRRRHSGGPYLRKYREHGKRAQ